MSSLQIRAHIYSDADYTAGHALHKAVDPRYQLTLEQAIYYDSLWDPKYQRHHVLAELDGATVAAAGYAEWPWWYEAGRYVINIKVHPAYRRQGIGTQLYSYLLDRLAQTDPKGRILMCKCWEDDPASERFLRQRGFQHTGGDRISILDVTNFDSARYVDAVERVSQQGIAIIDHAELVRRFPDYQRRCYAMHWDSFQDVPATRPRTQPPFEQYLKQTFENPDFVPEAYFAALDGEQLVGESNLLNDSNNPDCMITDYTGVIRSHRRRGIATVLKLRCIGYAKARGIKVITTGNDATNPMYQLNLQLGFQPQPGELFFELQLDHP